LRFNFVVAAHRFEHLTRHFLRFASGAFYEAIVRLTSCGIIASKNV
jgi:hypothetical protein